MPGIVGIIGPCPRDDRPEATLDRMLGVMRHESFYGSGTFRNEEVGCWLGWTCREGSFADCLPVWNEARNICLIFAGESFADPEDLQNLKALGHDFEKNTASYVVHLYEEFGTRFLDKLNGWFSGVIVDLRERNVILFNDRFGFSRIYCHQRGETLFFSSEAKALLKVLPATRQLDVSGFAEYCACGCALGGRTIFSGLQLLPGAAQWRYSFAARWKKHTYFERQSWENQDRLNAEDYYQALKQCFTKILPRYLNGRERAAVSLTGGLDGRMIMAWAKAPRGGLPCYTFGGTYRDCTDVKIARQIATLCDQPHHVIEVGDQFLHNFSDLAGKTVYLSDGAMDVTGAVELYVNKIARATAPVRITGNYGSEILRGNVAFRARALCDGLFEPELTRLVKGAADSYSEELRVHPLSFIAFKQVPWHHYSRLSIEQSQLTLRAPYLDNELVALAYRAPQEMVASKEACFRLIQEGNARLSRIPTDRGLYGSRVSVLAPVQHWYQEFTFRAEYAFDYGMPQWLARLNHITPAPLERLFLGRHKFYHFRVWYRDQLAHYVREMLLDPRSRARPYLRGDLLEKMVQSHLEGRGNFTSQIHQVLTLELIHRELIERN
jgi:asparagine synthase (glutamine-hydrolysing)